MPDIRVAVVIPCFNGGATVRDAVDSVRSQDEESELVVVDDGSRDPTTDDVLGELEVEGVRVVRQANAGLGAARMAGVTATSAPLVLPLDCDDVLLPGAVRHLADLLTARRDAGVAWGGYERFGRERTIQPLAPTLDAWQLIHMNELPATALIRREVLVSTGGWRLRGNYEDWDLWLTFAERGIVGVGSPQLTFRYRRMGTGMLQGAHDDHAAHYERLADLHRELFASRRRLWWRSTAPLALRLTLPVVEALPVPRERKRLVGSILSHVAHRRGSALLVRRMREVQATRRATADARISQLGLMPERGVAPGRPSLKRTVATYLEAPHSATWERLVLATARAVVLSQRLRGTGNGMAVVYHRVDPLAGDHERELLPALELGAFERQLDLLAALFDIVPAADLPDAALRRGRGGRLPLAITFDDDDPGHLRWAAPLLRSRGLPATFFLCGTSLDGPRAYWWQRLQLIGNRGLTPPAALPGDLFLAAQKITGLPPDEREAVDAEMAVLLGPDPPDSGLRRAQVAALARDFDIGFHTAEHHALDTVRDDRLAAALTDGRTALEVAVGRRCRAIAYPNGRFDDRTAAAARAAGFEVGFTTRATPLRPETDPRLIGRLEARSGSLAVFGLKLALVSVRR